jgi:hypothetical protein
MTTTDPKEPHVPASEDLNLIPSWPPWLEGLDTPARIRAIVDAVAREYADVRPESERDPREPHCTAAIAVMYLEALAGPGEDGQDASPPSEPVMDLLETAWTIIANAGEGDWGSLPSAWREAAERWRDRYHAALAAYVARNPAPPAPAEPPLPDGEYARVEVMGHDEHTGWVTKGGRAGVRVMVIRDWDGRTIAEVPGQSLYRFVPLATPLKRPAPQDRTAIAGGTGHYVIDIGEDDYYDERGPF